MALKAMELFIGATVERCSNITILTLPVYETHVCPGAGTCEVPVGYKRHVRTGPAGQVGVLRGDEIYVPPVDGRTGSKGIR